MFVTRTLAVVSLPWWLLALWPLLLAVTGRAQAPAGGYVPRRVEHLLPVPEPPGGLVPYGAGGLWGYADTTGRVWIQPVFKERPSFFFAGIGQVDNKNPRGFEPMKSPAAYTFVNARGEYVQPDTSSAVLRTAEGGLHVVKRRACLLSPAVFRFVRRPGTGQVAMDTIWVELRSRGIVDTEMLGQGRGAAYRRQDLGRKAALKTEANQGALINARGQALTRFAYARIYPFHEGIAAFQRTGYFEGGWGLMNRQGQEITTGVYYSIQAMRRNRAMLLRNGGPGFVQGAIIDTTGQFVRGWQDGMLTWAIPGHLLSESTGRRSLAQLAPFRLLDRDGHAVLGGQLFAKAVALPQAGTVAVKDLAGHWGVLGADLRWLIPCTAEHLRGNGRYEPGVELAEYGTNPARFVQLKVQGKWGIVRASDGQQLVPCRYDTLYTPLEGGWLCAGRQGKPYVIKDGREIAEATLDLPDLSGTDQLPGYRAIQRGREVTVIDSTGQLMCPWTPVGKDLGRMRMPQYLGRGLTLLFVYDQDRYGYGGVYARGRTVIPFRYITYQFREGLLLARQTSDTGHDVYSAFDAQGKALGPPLTRLANLLPGGWAILDEGRVLVHRSGQVYPAPAGGKWVNFPQRDGDSFIVPFEHGVMSAVLLDSYRAVYITRSGTVIPGR